MKKIFLSLVFLSSVSKATSIDWSGGYRVEYVSIDRPSLAEPKESKTYGLNFLYLQPKIIGSDGINIISRFDVFSSNNAAYRNSQVGAIIGSGLDDGTGDTGNNVNSQTQDSSLLRVSQLYLNVNHEFGSLLVGRAPIEFGMGITHNAGRGEFDHWIDTKEVLSYRFVVDNISFAPMFARVKQQDFGGGIANDLIYHFEYDNKDIGAKVGVFHQTRTAGPSTNDATVADYPGGSVRDAGYKAQTVNIYLERKWTAFEFKLEGSFLTGNTGVATATGEQIKLNSYAVVTEMFFPRGEGSWEFGSKLGVVSGDNPTTTAFEGYQLDRNYDVGILLFNHRMGDSTLDLHNTKILHSTDTANGLSIGNSVDDEAIGNTLFIAPSLKYTLNEKLDLKTTVVYAQMMVSPNNFNDIKKDLGLELDMEVIYRPRERVTWSTGLGILSPGSAWSGGSANYDNKTNYGLTTKAAITF